MDNKFNRQRKLRIRGIKRFKKYHGYHPYSDEAKKHMTSKEINKLVGIYGSTAKICSCYVCCNARRRKGTDNRTLQELREAYTEKEQTDVL